MSLLHRDSDPSDRQLRQFGSISMVALPLLAWLWGGSSGVIVALAITGVVIASTSLVRPTWVKPLFVGLMLLVAPIGAVVGELAMILIYYGMFVPIGLVFRAAGRDGLNLKLDRQAKSYWTSKKQPSNVAGYYRQS